MPETIADTGPVLHLHEIDRLDTLSTVAPLTFPDLVAAELRSRGLDPQKLNSAGARSTVVSVKRSEWEEILLGASSPSIQPADAQVFALARSTGSKRWF